MSEPVDSQSRRDLLTKLLPSIAISAIKMGVAGSPLSVLAAAADKYNADAEKTKGMVRNLLPLIPGFEKLQMTTVGSNAVSLLLQPQDLLSCAEVYLSRVFKLEGADGAPSGPPAGEFEKAMFPYVLRLPLKSVYLKVVEELTEVQLSKYVDFARRVNPAEVWLVADRGQSIDQRMDPVFVSENKTLRGRVKTVFTSEMLGEFFGRKFGIELQRLDFGAARVTLRLLS